jgi:hypothetical protein
MHAHTGLNLGESTGTLSSPRNMVPGNTGLSSTSSQARQPLQQPITPPATQQSHHTTQPPVQQSCPVNQLPTQHVQPNSLPPTGPVAPAGGNRQPANSPQVIRPAAEGNSLVNPETTPPVIVPTLQSQVDEIQSLRARLERYEKDGTPLANSHQPQTLFTDQDTIDHVKAATTPSKDDGKKPVLPNVVPRFKASSLKVGKPLFLSFTMFLCSGQHLSCSYHLCAEHMLTTWVIGPTA